MQYSINVVNKYLQKLPSLVGMSSHLFFHLSKYKWLNAPPQNDTLVWKDHRIFSPKIPRML